MNTPKHTPGPWTTEGADITNGYPEQGARVFIAEKVFSEHDATLIAAAPAMYEALQAAYKLLREWTPSGEDNQGEVEGLIENALAQAEGR